MRRNGNDTPRLVKTAAEMEIAHKSGNIRGLFQLIRSLGRRPTPVSETIGQMDGTRIHNQARRMDHWAEHFEAQFSWATVTNSPNLPNVTNTWNLNLHPPIVDGIRRNLVQPKRIKLAVLITSCQLYSKMVAKVSYLRYACFLRKFGEPKVFRTIGANLLLSPFLRKETDVFVLTTEVCTAQINKLVCVRSY